MFTLMKYDIVTSLKLFFLIWAHSRRSAPETGLFGAPLSLRPRRCAPCLLRTPTIPLRVELSEFAKRKLKLFKETASRFDFTV
jgi:hypothetical protein